MQPFPKTGEAGQTEHFCTVLWAMAPIEDPVCGGSSFRQICFWLRLLLIPFLLTGIYSVDGNLKFTMWKHWETSAVVVPSSNANVYSPAIELELFQSHNPHNTWSTRKAYLEEVCSGSIWAFWVVVHLNWLGVHLRCQPQNLEHHTMP